MSAQPEEEQLSNVDPRQLKSNLRVLSNLRIICALFSGAACGILGVQGLSGFGLYFAQHAAATLLVIAKTHGQPGKYFFSGYKDAALAHIAASETFMTFLLVWTIAFNLAHIF